MQEKAASKSMAEFVKSEAEWRELFTPHQFRVARNHRTERALSHARCKEKWPGMRAMRRTPWPWVAGDPEPTVMRYCSNGQALKFQAGA
jgi:peptide methionine sulfoxide reductase MsrB